MPKAIDSNRVSLTTSDASERSGLSTTHLTRLLRSGKLEGVQLGREWLIYADSLEKYLATPRKPGPRGPIKKDVRNDDQVVSRNGEGNSD